MNVLIDENGYLTSYAVVGSLCSGTDVPEPDDIEFFVDNWRAFKLENDILVFDAEKKAELEAEMRLSELRYLRETECFPIINRGILWYDTLSDEQKSELQSWYRAWLDVTETLIIPQKPNLIF